MFLMRVLHKILLNLVLGVIFFILFYVFRTRESSSDGHYTSSFDSSCYTCTHSSIIFDTRHGDSSGRPSTLEIATPYEMESGANYVYNVWCIFTKVTSHAPMKHKFHTFTNSLFHHSSGHVALHIIIDNSSRSVAQEVLETVKETTQKEILVIK
jgi:hypothetical protein